MRKVFVGLIVLGIVSLIGAAELEAGYKKWNVGGLTAAIVAGAADTSSSIPTTGCDNGFICVTFEGDSAKVGIEGTIGGSAVWWTVMAATQLNGVDGTYDVQLYQPIKGHEDADAFYVPLPMPDFLRVIVNNDDDADDLGSLNVRIWCQY